MRAVRRADPAPSRLAYKWARLWLTPSFRRAVRRGVPALAVAGALAWWLHDGAEIAALRAQAAEVLAGIEARPEFAVATVEVVGASPALRREVEAVLPALPASSLALDLGAVREAVLAVPAVASAEIRVARGGVLRIEAVERPPVALWREGRLHALSEDGRALREVAARTDHPDLPLLAGEGAEAAVAEALAIRAADGALGPRVIGLIRVGDRRWDVVLAGGRRILLPARGAPEAMARAGGIEARHALDARAVLDLDMRDPRRVVLRLAPGAIDLMRAREAERLAAARAAAQAFNDGEEGR